MSLSRLQNLSDQSSAMASSVSGQSDLASSAKRMSAFPRSNIKVNLANHFTSKIYTSSSPVAGDVTITTKRDVHFDSIQIVLIGCTRTKVEGVNAPHEITHTFLKMIMPIPESTYPVPRVLENGQTYTIPFNFVIPNQLTINACNHSMLSPRLQDQHTLLPPSMGQWEKDDMAPLMAHVDYSIKARVLRQDDLNGKRASRIMEASQTLNVLPASVEEPPLSITPQDRLYNMVKTKSLRKNILSSKIGRLTAEAVQPTPAVLRSDGIRMVSQPTAQVLLTFDPTSTDTAPPKITGVTGKVTAHTYYSSGTIASFPNLGEWSQQFVTDKRGFYSTSVSLPAIPAPKASWKQQLTAATRRDSGYSSESSPEANARTPVSTAKSTSRGSPIFHTASVQIPIALPVHKKTFIPTFHSCIASRVYTVQLSLAVAIGSASTTVTLTMPLQVAVEADLHHHGGLALPSFEAAVEESEADAHLRPRVLEMPASQFVETSVLPGYAVVAARG